VFVGRPLSLLACLAQLCHMETSSHPGLDWPGPASSGLPPEAMALAGRMYDAARQGSVDIFRQALPAGLPANMTNEKGDTLV
jgi:hypothetical protein